MELPEKFCKAKPVLVPMRLPMIWESLCQHRKRLCGNAKWLCPEGSLVYRFCVPDCISAPRCIPTLYYLTYHIDTCLDYGFVKEVVFGLGLSGISLFSGIMEGLTFRMFFIMCRWDDGEATLRFFCL